MWRLRWMTVLLHQSAIDTKMYGDWKTEIQRVHLAFIHWRGFVDVHQSSAQSLSRWTSFNHWAIISSIVIPTGIHQSSTQSSSQWTFPNRHPNHHPSLYMISSMRSHHQITYLNLPINQRWSATQWIDLNPIFLEGWHHWSLHQDLDQDWIIAQSRESVLPESDSASRSETLVMWRHPSRYVTSSSCSLTSPNCYVSTGEYIILMAFL